MPQDPIGSVPASGLWNITVRLNIVSGDGCVGDMMQSQVGVPKGYSLSIGPNGSQVNVTLTSASGDYACTFTGGSADSSGFTFGATGGMLTCERGDVIRGIRCADGMLKNIFALGQNLSGRASGNEISGTGSVSWTEWSDLSFAVETKAQFTGSRP